MFYIAIVTAVISIVALAVLLSGCVARYELRGSADDILARELAGRPLYPPPPPAPPQPTVNSPRTTIQVR
jgi:hypothetical protein